MGCCGNRNGSSGVQYEVKTNKGGTFTVDTLVEVRLKLSAHGGGSYKSVPKPATPK